MKTALGVVDMWVGGFGMVFVGCEEELRPLLVLCFGNAISKDKLKKRERTM
jgi:hypothetical protein